MTEEFALKLIATILTLAAISIGLYQYIVAQKWKRLEFVANQIKEFELDTDVVNAKFMLDWNGRNINLFPDNEINDERYIKVTNDIVINSLSRKEKYEISEIKIRDTFDVFFTKLEEFESYISTGLIKYKDIEPYLGYWLDILNDKENKRKNKMFVETVHKFLNEWNYEGVLNLMELYNSSKKVNHNYKVK